MTKSGSSKQVTDFKAYPARDEGNAGGGVGVGIAFVSSRSVVSLKKVLIVDDSVAETRLMESMLQQAGYWPVALNDPTRLEQMLEMEHPGLILLDVVMPERNGFQACRDLKNHEEFSRIPIIFVTSKNSASDRFWAEKQGGDGFVGKPFTTQELLSEVRKFI